MQTKTYVLGFAVVDRHVGVLCLKFTGKVVEQLARVALSAALADSNAKQATGTWSESGHKYNRIDESGPRPGPDHGDQTAAFFSKKRY